MLWFWSSLAVAVIWGLSYTLTEQTLKNGISVSAQLALGGTITLPLYYAIALSNGSLATSLQSLRGEPKLLGYFILIPLLNALGAILVFWSIQMKNATLVSLIEISYPLFVALFSILLFQNNHLTTGSAIGGALIFTGIAVMYFVK